MLLTYIDELVITRYVIITNQLSTCYSRPLMALLRYINAKLMIAHADNILRVASNRLTNGPRVPVSTFWQIYMAPRSHRTAASPLIRKTIGVAFFHHFSFSLSLSLSLLTCEKEEAHRIFHCCERAGEEYSAPVHMHERLHFHLFSSAVSPLRIK